MCRFVVAVLVVVVVVVVAAEETLWCVYVSVCVYRSREDWPAIHR